jgi:hypothetical protein
MAKLAEMVMRIQPTRKGAMVAMHGYLRPYFLVMYPELSEPRAAPTVEMLPLINQKKIRMIIYKKG